MSNANGITIPADHVMVTLNAMGYPRTGSNQWALFTRFVGHSHSIVSFSLEFSNDCWILKKSTCCMFDPMKLSVHPVVKPEVTELFAVDTVAEVASGSFLAVLHAELVAIRVCLLQPPTTSQES